MIYLPTLIIILKVLGLSFVITKFEPIIWVVEAIQNNFKKPIFGLIFGILKTILTCFSCCSMWIGFLMGGLWVGIISYIISFIYLKKLSRWETTINFPSFDVDKFEEELKKKKDYVKD